MRSVLGKAKPGGGVIFGLAFLLSKDLYVKEVKGLTGLSYRPTSVPHNNLNLLQIRISCGLVPSFDG